MKGKKRRGWRINRRIKRIKRKTLIRLTIAFILSILFAFIIAITSDSFPGLIERFNRYKGTYYPYDKERIDYLKVKGRYVSLPQPGKPLAMQVNQFQTNLKLK
ncbi:MAG: hypothetical protein HY999_02220 [Nitrospinae bacterium]|nr:hypothetical protein [Nitrospinota bacterium]